MRKGTTQFYGVTMKEWRKKPELLSAIRLKGLQLDDRELRKRIADFNRAYDGKENRMYIVHSVKGYKMTSDADEIKESIEENERRAVTMLKQGRKVRKILKMKAMRAKYSRPLVGE